MSAAKLTLGDTRLTHRASTLPRRPRPLASTQETTSTATRTSLRSQHPTTTLDLQLALAPLAEPVSELVFSVR